VDSDGSLTKGPSNRVKPVTSRTYGWVNDHAVLPPESPRRSTQERSGAMAPSVGSKQLLEGLLVALVPSSLGLVAYAILREAYVWFYQRYGVAPEEVGLTQLRVLSSMFRFCSAPACWCC
jgi:hypothetical protein